MAAVPKWNVMPKHPIKPSVKPVFVPQPDAIYICDGGMVLCGVHLGTSARMTGRDISGQKIAKATAKDHLAWTAEFGHPMRCESCEAKVAAAIRNAFRALTGVVA